MNNKDILHIALQQSARMGTFFKLVLLIEKVQYGAQTFLDKIQCSYYSSSQQYHYNGMDIDYKGTKGN